MVILIIDFSTNLDCEVVDIPGQKSEKAAAKKDKTPSGQVLTDTQIIDLLNCIRNIGLVDKLNFYFPVSRKNAHKLEASRFRMKDQLFHAFSLRKHSFIGLPHSTIHCQMISGNKSGGRKIMQESKPPFTFFL